MRLELTAGLRTRFGSREYTVRVHARLAAFFSALLLASASVAGSSCSLLVDTDGLSGGPVGDSDASSNTEAGSPPSPSQDGGQGDVTQAADSAPPAPDIAFVQARENDSPTALNLSTTFGSDVRAHSAIIVCISIYTLAVSVSAISDSLGNSYTTVVGPFDGNGTRHYIAVALDVAGGPDTVTVTVNGNPSPYLGLHIHEYAGLARQGAFDVGSAAAGTSSAVDGMASGAKATTADHELIFGYGVSSDTAYPGTGFTARSGFSTGDVTEDKVVSVQGTYQATATMVSGTNWEMLMATFKGD
jgi:hypothetical protein